MASAIKHHGQHCKLKNYIEASNVMQDYVPPNHSVVGEVQTEYTLQQTCQHQTKLVENKTTIPILIGNRATMRNSTY